MPPTVAEGTLSQLGMAALFIPSNWHCASCNQIGVPLAGEEEVSALAMEQAIPKLNSITHDSVGEHSGLDSFGLLC